MNKEKNEKAVQINELTVVTNDDLNTHHFIKNEQKKLETRFPEIGSLLYMPKLSVLDPTKAPNGYLLCDGSSFDTERYPKLKQFLTSDSYPDPTKVPNIQAQLVSNLGDLVSVWIKADG